MRESPVRSADLPRARRTSLPDEEEYRFASEVAARYFEHRAGLTIDKLLCDPGTAVEFDAMAAKIAPVLPHFSTAGRRSICAKDGD